jgi:hypothetical protein
VSRDTPESRAEQIAQHARQVDDARRAADRALAVEQERLARGAARDRAAAVRAWLRASRARDALLAATGIAQPRLADLFPPASEAEIAVASDELQRGIA